MNVNNIALPNGLKVCFIPNKEVGSVTIHLKGLTGSNFEKDNQIGSAHILEHFNTSRNDGNKIISNGGKIIGITSRDDVLFMIKVSKKDVFDGLDFLSHVFDKDTISKEDLEKLKSISIQEIKRIRNNPEKFLGRVSCSTLFPYGRTSKLNIGEEKYLNRLTIKDIIEFRDLHYYPNNFVLGLSGNFIISNVSPYIKKLFGRFNKGNQSKQELHKYTDGLAVKNYVFKSLTQNLMKIDYKGFQTTDDSKYYGILIANILDSFLKKLIKDRLGMSYVVECKSFSAGSYGIFSIYLSCDAKNLQMIIREVKRIISNFQEIINSRTVDNAKTKVLSNYNFSFEDISFRAEYHSDLLLHGRKDQDLELEMKMIGGVSYSGLKKASLDLFSQQPKITVISPQLCVDEIKKIWLNNL